MVRVVDPSPSPVDGKVGYDPSPTSAVKALRFGSIAVMWHAFLAGPRLQSGLALALLVVVSLILWAGLVAAILLVLRHI
jgi:hypothetical protein